MYNDNYLQHHGIKGMKWGVRRWQNPDGSLTPEGEKRYLESQEVVQQYNTSQPKFSERVKNNVKNASEFGYNAGYTVLPEYDLPAVIGTILGGAAGSVLSLPMATIQSKYDKRQYKKASEFIEKYKDVYVKDLIGKEELDK